MIILVTLAPVTQSTGLIGLSEFCHIVTSLQDTFLCVTTKGFLNLHRDTKGPVGDWGMTIMTEQRLKIFSTLCKFSHISQNVATVHLAVFSGLPCSCG